MKFSTLSLLSLAAGTMAEQWDNPDGGDIVIEGTNTKVKWGTVKPWDAITRLREHCPSNKCQGKGDDATFKLHGAIVTDGGSNDNYEVSVSVDGSFQTPGQGNYTIEALIAILVEYAYEMTTIETKTYNSANGCQFNPMGCNPDDSTTQDEYTLTDQISLSVRDNANEQPIAELSVSVSVKDTDVQANTDFCTDLLGAAATIAGLVTPLGAGFSLGSLLC